MRVMRDLGSLSWMGTTPPFAASPEWKAQCTERRLSRNQLKLGLLLGLFEETRARWSATDVPDAHGPTDGTQMRVAAHLVEHEFPKLGVAGSNPVRRSERRASFREVTGARPFGLWCIGR